MRRYFYTFAIITVCSLAVLAQAPAPPVTFTEKDREFAIKYMTETRDEFVKQLTGLSDAQLNFRAGEGRWTIGEIAEHIIVVENELKNRFNAPTAKKTFGADVPRVADTAIVLAITNRGQKFTAPEQVRPNGRWKTRDELLSNFEKTRTSTIEWMKTNKEDLRSTFVRSPMGMVDSFQSMLFLTGHSDRHLAQLREVKADKKYPAK